MNNEDSYNGGEFTTREKGMSVFSGFLSLVVIGLIVVIALYATGTIKYGNGNNAGVANAGVVNGGVAGLNGGLGNTSNKNSGAPVGTSVGSGGVIVASPGPNAYVTGKCMMSDWSPWSSCNKACANADGPGTQMRTRKVNDLVNSDGNPCPQTVEKEVRACNEGACPLDYVNVYAGADRTWDMHEFWLPQSSNVWDVPAPNDVESSGPLFQASISECQAFCNENVDCDLIVYSPSSAAFDGQSSCIMKQRRPDLTSVNMSDDEFKKFTTWCKEEANCKPY